MSILFQMAAKIATSTGHSALSVTEYLVTKTNLFSHLLFSSDFAQCDLYSFLIVNMNSIARRCNEIIVIQGIC